jgi:maltose alpha-D-glucosyltransferase/alpha-amylase
LLRSFDYAVAVASTRTVDPAQPDSPRRPAILDRFAEDAGNAFLAAYRAGHSASQHRWVGEESETALLDLFLMQKAAYEICYEAANRPAWLGIPLDGLARIADRTIATAESVDA